MWSHHTLSIPSAGLHEKADAAGELEVADVEHVVYCNWDDTQKVIFYLVQFEVGVMKWDLKL